MATQSESFWDQRIDRGTLPLAVGDVLVIGLVLLLLAWKPEVAPAWTGIIPIIFGGTGALYMLHVWVTK